jgi:substrate-binding family protein
LPGTDIDRGYLIADFLVNSPKSTDPGQRGLGASRIEIVADENIAQLAKVLKQALEHKGITPVGIDCFKPIDTYNKDHFCSQLDPSIEAFSIDNMAALATKIRDEHADAVFFNGLNIQGAGLLVKNLRELGLNQVPLVGAAGVFVGEADKFFGTIGSHEANAYAILAGTDPSTFTSGAAATFSRKYQDEFHRSPEPLSAGGYNAANIVIQAIKGLIDAGKPVTKESVVQAVLSGNFTGVTGNHIHFDQNGDNIGQRDYTTYQSQQPSPNSWNWKVFATRQTG